MFAYVGPLRIMEMFADFEERNLIKINLKHFYFCLSDSLLINYTKYRPKTSCKTYNCKMI